MVPNERRATKSDAVPGGTRRAGPVFLPCGVAARLCGWATLRSRRLAWQENRPRRAPLHSGNRPWTDQSTFLLYRPSETDFPGSVNTSRLIFLALCGVIVLVWAGCGPTDRASFHAAHPVVERTVDRPGILVESASGLADPGRAYRMPDPPCKPECSVACAGGGRGRRGRACAGSPWGHRLRCAAAGFRSGGLSYRRARRVSRLPGYRAARIRTGCGRDCSG